MFSPFFFFSLSFYYLLSFLFSLFFFSPLPVNYLAGNDSGMKSFEGNKKRGTKYNLNSFHFFKILNESAC